MMNKIVYNRKSVPTLRLNGIWISFCARTGYIVFSKELAFRFDLGKNNKVLFVQDEERPQDWYIEFSDDANAFEIVLRERNDGRGPTTTYQVTSSFVVKQLLQSLKIGTTDAVRFKVSLEPTEENTYAIITKDRLK